MLVVLQSVIKRSSNSSSSSTRQRVNNLNSNINNTNINNTLNTLNNSLTTLSVARIRLLLSSKHLASPTTKGTADGRRSRDMDRAIHKLCKGVDDVC